jgi:hypothetical protein
VISLITCTIRPSCLRFNRDMISINAQCMPTLNNSFLFLIGYASDHRVSSWSDVPCHKIDSTSKQDGVSHDWAGIWRHACNRSNRKKEMDRSSHTSVHLSIIFPVRPSPSQPCVLSHTTNTCLPAWIIHGSRPFSLTTMHIGQKRVRVWQPSHQMEACTFAGIQ